MKIEFFHHKSVFKTCHSVMVVLNFRVCIVSIAVLGNSAKYLFHSWIYDGVSPQIMVPFQPLPFSFSRDLSTVFHRSVLRARNIFLLKNLVSSLGKVFKSLEFNERYDRNFLYKKKQNRTLQSVWMISVHTATHVSMIGTTMNARYCMEIRSTKTNLLDAILHCCVSFATKHCSLANYELLATGDKEKNSTFD